MRNKTWTITWRKRQPNIKKTMGKCEVPDWTDYVAEGQAN